MAFVRGGNYDTFYQNNLYLRELSSGAETLLQNNSDYLVSFDWTADSQSLVYDLGEFIAQVHRDGTGFKQLPLGTGYDDAPAIDRVSGRIAYHNQSGLQLENLDGTARAAIPNVAAGAQWPEWSPDGQWLSYRDQTNVWKIRPDGSEQLQLTTFSEPDQLNGFTSPWTADGAAVWVLATVNQVRGLYAVPTNGSGAMQQVQTSAGAPLAWVSRRAPAVQTVPGGGTVRIVSIRFDGTAFVVHAAIAGAGQAQLERMENLSTSGWEPVGDPVTASGRLARRDPTSRGASVLPGPRRALGELNPSPARTAVRNQGRPCVLAFHRG